MKTGKKILIGVVIAALFITLLSNIGQFSDAGKEAVAYAAPSIWNSNGNYTKSLTTTGKLGSESNPFVVLEIVPNNQQAQFGYLVGGQEPIDISEISAMAESATKTEIASTLSNWFTKEKKGTTPAKAGFGSDFGEGELDSYRANYIEGPAETANRYSDYVYVGHGGDYKLNRQVAAVKVESIEEAESAGRTVYISLAEPHLFVENYYFSYGFDDISEVVGLMGRYVYNESTKNFELATWKEEGTLEPKRTYTMHDGYEHFIELYVKSNGEQGERVKTVVDEVSSYEFERGYGDYIDLKDYNYYNRRMGFPSVEAALVSVLGEDYTKYLKVVNGQTYIALDNPSLEFGRYDGQSYYVIKYTYTFEEVNDNSGDYKLQYKNYADSALIAQDPVESATFTKIGATQFVYTEEEYEEHVAAHNEYPETAKGKVEEGVTVYSFYSWKLVNREYFKKYALGLVYEDETYAKGEDVTKHEFLGWYYDKYGVNPFNGTKQVTENTTVYAKWAARYADETKNDNLVVNFDKNTDEVVTDFHFDQSIENIARGDKIIAPDATPHRAGYVFTGWYKDSSCTSKITFPYTVNEPQTLYAGWRAVRKTINVKFDVNVRDVSEVSGIPGTAVAINENNRTVENGTVSALSVFEGKDPERPGYKFVGWYWEADCITPYDFDAPLPDGYSSSSLTLYAQWVSEERIPSYKITFNKNEPEKAEVSAVGKDDPIIVPYESTAEAQGFKSSDYILTLENNIDAKIENYHVQVVSVAASELKSANMPLITRANLIVLSSPVMNGTVDSASASALNSKLKEYFGTYRNKELFPDGISGKKYNDNKYTFADRDITFEAAKYILMKMTGSDTRTYGSICPIIFDYTAYNDITKSNSSATGYKGKLADNTTVSISDSDNKGWNNNVYKLWLMTQQMNPITLANAYFKDSPIANYSISDSGEFRSSGVGSATVWNKYTLIPWDTISSENWNKYKENRNNTTGFDLVGVTIDTELATGFNFSKINHRVLIYNDPQKDSVSKAFEEFTALPKNLNENIYESFGKHVNDGDIYCVADGIHFMLTETDVYENFDKDLSILELEPAAKFNKSGYPESFKSDSYWFWMLSRYVPNYSGNTKVTRMSTSQFIGDISEINSNYDILYIGGNTNGIVDEWMPVAQKKAKFPKGAENAFKIGDTAVAQTINVGFWKKTTAMTTVSQTKVDSSYSKVEGHWLNVTWDSRNNTLVANTSYETDSLLKFKDLYRSNSYSSSYAPYGTVSGGYVTSPYLNPGSKAYYNGTTALTISVKKSSSGSHLALYDGDWYYADVYINDYYVKSGSEWVHCLAGTSVTNGDVIYLDEDANLKIKGETGTYVYAHTGRMLNITGNSEDERLLKNGSGLMLYGTETSVEYTALSGNDLTKVKYDDLMDFARAGYPVIIGSEILTSGNTINTALVDTSSYIYKFLTTLTGDEYKKTCFFENVFEVSHEEDFLKALKNKTFELKMYAKPIEYKDKTAAAYNGLSDADIYVNGRDINNKVLKYVFKIDGNAADTYTLKFYVDTNADGKFTPATERLDSAEIAVVKYVGVADNTDMMADPENYEKVGGGATRQDNLVAGKTYLLTVYTGDIIGGIPWKVEIVSNSNSLVSDETMGLCAIKAVSKAHAYVLQILPNTSGTDWKRESVVFPDNDEVDEAERHGGVLQSVTGGYVHTKAENDSVYQNAQKFYEYTRSLEDFEVEFFKLTVDQFVEFTEKRQRDIDSGLKNELSSSWLQKEHTEYEYSNPASVNNVRESEISNYNDSRGYYNATAVFAYTNKGRNYYTINYYRNRTSKTVREDFIGFEDGVLTCNAKDGSKATINMLVVGFADCYSDIKSEVACGVINEFITSGKAVLFTHDTTSHYMVEGASNSWGVYINRYFRSILKLDRYDVMKYGDGGWDYKTINADAGDWPFATDGKQILSMDYMATSGSGANTVALLQGYTSMAQVNVSASSSDVKTTRVTKSNEGQLTTYPYFIPDDMTVAETHGQYWQLDFEDDDIVVWYCLANPYTNESTLNRKFYRTLNDVRNNYYIYSAGNITYTGVGHQLHKLSNDEVKLFVNTMVAAYKSITSASKPEILNSDKSTDSDSREYLYISYDETITEVDADPIMFEIFKEEDHPEVFCKRVFFTVKSYAIVLNKQLTMHLYPVYGVDADHKKVYREYPMHLVIKEYDESDPYNKDKWKDVSLSAPFDYTYNDSDGVGVTASVYGYIVESGKTYFMDVPISDSYYKQLFEGGHGTSFPEVTFDTVSGGTEIKSIDQAFALDSNSSFELKLEILMRYGKDPDKNKPLPDSVNLIFTRRGLFSLD
jgi:uncharacterized repeat protein (TIGR02543 family)